MGGGYDSNFFILGVVDENCILDGHAAVVRSLVRGEDCVAAYSGLSNKLAYASIWICTTTCYTHQLSTCPGHTIAVRTHRSRVLDQCLIIPAALTVFSPDGHLFQVCFPRASLRPRTRVSCLVGRICSGSGEKGNLRRTYHDLYPPFAVSH